MNAEPVVAFKAFNADWTCRGFKYELGKTYEHTGPLSMCNSGFHACALPFDCWRYYQDSLTFARVRIEGAAGQREDDSKVVGAKITIEASLALPEWIKAQVATVIDLCKAAKGALTSADREPAATTGEGANAATTGNWANAATTGNWANAATTGEGANAATTGEGANAATTGNWANAATTGKSAIASATGLNSRAKAGEKGCVVVAWWDKKADRPRVTVGYVGRNGIKADTWYRANERGKLIKAEDDE